MQALSDDDFLSRPPKVPAGSESRPAPNDINPHDIISGPVSESTVVRNAGPPEHDGATTVLPPPQLTTRAHDTSPHPAESGEASASSRRVTTAEPAEARQPSPALVQQQQQAQQEQAQQEQDLVSRLQQDLEAERRSNESLNAMVRGLEGRIEGIASLFTAQQKQGQGQGQGQGHAEEGYYEHQAQAAAPAPASPRPAQQQHHHHTYVDAQGRPVYPPYGMDYPYSPLMFVTMENLDARMEAFRNEAGQSGQGRRAVGGGPKGSSLAG